MSAMRANFPDLMRPGLADNEQRRKQQVQDLTVADAGHRSTYSDWSMRRRKPRSRESDLFTMFLGR